MRIAIDTGGTFTDCVYWSGDELRVLKVPSTPADPGRAVLQAVEQIAGGESVEVRHGTTVGTNTLLERTGARVVFVTTAGFEDTIEIGRQARPRLYDWFWKKEPALAPGERRFGVMERVSAEGEILRSVDESELRSVKEAIAEQKPESIGVSLLFSFANPVNEKNVVAALRELGVPVTASHELLPEFREFERGSTVLINAYLAPRMKSYLETLDKGLQARRSRLDVMQSSGGILPASVALREPVRTILSGPAGGVIGAIAVARAAGFSKILTFDMGGTSTDVSLMEVEGTLQTTTESQVMGLPVAVPMLDIHTVGAGGGSLANFDVGQALKVGPESAGADPGPACYGRGERPTVTDANLVLGRLDAEHFLAGGMRLDEERAKCVLDRTKGRLDRSEDFAEGIVRLCDAHMEKALRRISVERGHDPRLFTLVSFGGAGPLHACALARALRIPKVLVPVNPGALSAYGILVSDAVRDYSRTVMIQPSDAAIEEHFRGLENTGRKEMAEEMLEGSCARSLDLRYAGQGYELNVDWCEDFVAAFHRLHEQRYGYADRERVVEVVNLRVRMQSRTSAVELKRYEMRAGDGCQAVLKRKPIRFDGKRCEAVVYQRDGLRCGDRFSGPAVIVEYSATTFLPPGSAATVDQYRNLILDV